MITEESEELIPSVLFNRILLQSSKYSSANPQQPTLELDAEKLLVNLASLFAQELVSQSSSAAQRRIGTSSSSSTNSIKINDVNFVLKHQWPLYDSSSYSQVPEK